MDMVLDHTGVSMTRFHYLILSVFSAVFISFGSFSAVLAADYNDGVYGSGNYGGCTAQQDCQEPVVGNTDNNGQPGSAAGGSGNAAGIGTTVAAGAGSPNTGLKFSSPVISMMAGIAGFSITSFVIIRYINREKQVS